MAFTTINKSTDHFNTVLYTGNNSVGHAITGVGFQPDWVWIKKRNATGQNNIVDAVRGVQNVIFSDDNGAQGTMSNNLTAFGTDGFTLGNGSLINDTSNFVSWNWKANGSGTSNTDGDVTSTVSANQTAGFSIVKVSNLNSNSFGHGLGAEPHLIINKRTDDIADWRVYYKGIASGKSLYLNTNDAESTEGSGIASATSSTVTVTGSGNGGTAGTGDTVYYCFAPIRGYSAIGTYVGNASTNGPFIYTGFKPAFVLVKIYSDGGSWYIYDNKRGPFNVNDSYLRPNSSNAETTGASFARMDFLSNGFKLRDNQNLNGSYNYIYMAFAEAPFVGSNNVAATAK